jgi:DNA-binding beta-propeller fold protein YncE
LAVRPQVALETMRRAPVSIYDNAVDRLLWIDPPAGNLQKEEKMKKLSAVLTLMLAWGAKSQAQEKAPLRLVQTVSFAGVSRHWDHMGADVQGNRLFVTSGEDAVIEVLDLHTNKKIQTITGLKGPHNVLPFPEVNKIFVTDGEASELKIYNYKTLELMGHTPLSIDADPIVYDPATKYFYIVNGGRAAHTPYCLISVVDSVTGKKLEDIKLDTNRLESMALEKSSQRLFVNMTTANVIGVVDRQKRALIATWPITAGLENVPMQYDESTHRLFVATRKPSRLVVVNTDTGKEVTSLPTADSVDDLAYDPALHRIYVPGGNLGGAVGAVTVIQQKDADHYEVLANIPTKPGARNARLVPELNKYYVSTATKAPQEAEILVFDVVP